ncbi:hypothetical protein AAFF_G00167400 [Aldrovandia affinis]|uniref:Uncharacterized protein n=1 Tax=Aldrovandia affinis TaxID=143900 RepID=A0AAD7RM16_9TELE|nr:hypothetical protein AAFF_G00167400 [Aldrovandia affinis]
MLTLTYAQTQNPKCSDANWACRVGESPSVIPPRAISPLSGNAGRKVLITPGFDRSQGHVHLASCKEPRCDKGYARLKAPASVSLLSVSPAEKRRSVQRALAPSV